MHIYRRARPRADSKNNRADAAHCLRQPGSIISHELVAAVLEPAALDEKSHSVCFTGHRLLPPAERRRLAMLLDKKLDALYQQGYRDFYCGGALGFDTLAADAVIRLKQHAPLARLIMAIPCPEQTKKWPPDDAAHYEHLLYQADRIHVLSSFYYAGCMQVRNRFMVDRSSLCLCYLMQMRGGTMSTVKYAMDQGCKLINLAIQD